MEYLKKFGERLRELIVEKEIEVAELSKTIAVDESVVYRWCKNLSIPNLGNLIRLADYFECSVDFLVGRANDYGEIKFQECPPFYEQLRKVKELRRLTSYKICKGADLSQYTFSLYLKNRRLPLVDSIIRLADFFDCTIDHLIGRES